MLTTYIERFARFGFALLAAALLLTALATMSPGAPANLSMSTQTHRPVAELVGAALPLSFASLAASLAYALPIALLLGVPAGLKPHGALDRVLQTPVVALMGVPAAVAGLLAIRSLAISARTVSIPAAAQTALVLLLAAWMARAVRNGMAGSRVDGAPVRWGQAAVAALGRILQQTGNLLAVTMLIEYLSPGRGRGIWGLVVQAVTARDIAVLYRSLWVMIAMVLVGHLAGDLLVTAAAREGERSGGRVSRTWLVLGGLLAAVLLLLPLFAGAAGPGAIDLVNHLQPPGPGHLLGTDQLGRDLVSQAASGARVSLTIGAAATLLALLPAGLLATLGWALGRWGMALLTPRTAAPNLLGPMLAGLVGAVLFRPSVATLILTLGLASIPTAALAFRQLYRPGHAIAPWQKALPALFGVIVLTFAQILLAEGALSFLGLGVMPPAVSLGSLGNQAAPFLSNAPHILWATLPGAAGLAGLFLLGYALTGPAEEPI